MTTIGIHSLLSRHMDEDRDISGYKDLYHLMAMESYASRFLGGIYPYGKSLVYDWDKWLRMLDTDKYPNDWKHLREYRRSILSDCLLAHLLTEGSKLIIVHKGRESCPAIKVGDDIYTRGGGVDIDRESEANIDTLIDCTYPRYITKDDILGAASGTYPFKAHIPGSYDINHDALTYHLVKYAREFLGKVLQ